MLKYLRQVANEIADYKTILREDYGWSFVRAYAEAIRVAIILEFKYRKFQIELRFSGRYVKDAEQGTWELKEFNEEVRR